MSEDRLKALIAEILRQSGRQTMSRRRLTALALVCDFEHYMTYGESISDAEYRLDENGVPVSDGMDALAAPPAATGNAPLSAGDAALGPDQCTTVGLIVADHAGSGTDRVVDHIREELAVYGMIDDGAVDFELYVDPLDDPAVRDAIMRDRELHRRVKRAEAEFRLRGKASAEATN